MALLQVIMVIIAFIIVGILEIRSRKKEGGQGSIGATNTYRG